MTRRWMQGLLAASCGLVVMALATPALAQNGTMSGRVLDSERRTTDRDGKPLAGKMLGPTDSRIGLSEATVTLDLQGDTPRQFKAITDAFGEWYKSGLPPGTYTVSIRREWRDPISSRTTKLVIFTAEASGIVLKPGEKLRVPDMAGLSEEARAKGVKPSVASNLSTAEADAANKRAAELEAMLKTANDAAAAGQHEDAIAQYTAFADKLAERGDKCAACYVKIGESQLALKNLEKAETAFLKSIEQDPNLAAPYAHLSNIYNAQRKFDEAAKMNDKATALMGGAGGAAGGGGGDATSNYNRGIINWNAGKYEEARGDFARAAQMDPKMANAQYYLGMAIFNLASSGKANMADAKAPFQEYLKLAPTGEYAEVAKAILATIK